MHNVIYKEYDVVVVGGGPGGIPAAIASSRRGCRTLIIERNSFLGGAACSGLGILGFFDRNGNKALGGIAQEIIDRLFICHGTLGHYRCPVHNSISAISPEEFKITALEMCKEAGVDVLFNQELLDVVTDNNRVIEIVSYGKCTEIRVKAKVFVDATGDGDLAFMAGAEFHTGQEESGIMQPSTLMFTVTNYNLEEFFSFIENNPSEYGIKEDYANGYNPAFFRNTPGHCFIGLTETIKKARANGDFDIPRNQFIYITSPTEGELAINTTRIINLDASDPLQLSSGLVEGYRQIKILMNFLHKYVPGFSRVRIASISPTLGIRETRHFKGIYTLTEDNMYSDYVKENAIAQSAYNIDIHSGIASHIDLSPVMEPFKIPYGCLVPSRIDSLILSGRTISMDKIPYASARVMGPCIAIGEAAGEAAAIAIENGVELRNIDLKKLQFRLHKSGNLF